MHLSTQVVAQLKFDCSIEFMCVWRPYGNYTDEQCNLQKSKFHLLN